MPEEALKLLDRTLADFAIRRRRESPTSMLVLNPKSAESLYWEVEQALSRRSEAAGRVPTRQVVATVTERPDGYLVEFYKRSLETETSVTGADGRVRRAKARAAPGELVKFVPLKKRVPSRLGIDRR